MSIPQGERSVCESLDQAVHNPNRIGDLELLIRKAVRNTGDAPSKSVSAGRHKATKRGVLTPTQRSSGLVP